MTDKRINIKIAELCGHPFEVREVCRICKGNTPYAAGDDYGITLWEECRHCDNTGKVAPYYVGLPNYANDLNACHEFEKTLNHINEWFYYEKALAEITDGYTFHATARQRCKAFLRIHNQ
jgi:hypothetical protein